MIAVLLGLLLHASQSAPGDALPAASSFNPAPVGMTFHGGPFDGLTTGEQVYQGKKWVSFVASKAPVSPVPDHLSAAVQSLIAGQEQRRPELYREYVLPDALTYGGCMWSCAADGTFLEVGFPFKETCKGNAPAYLSDGTVRIEWLCHDQLWYLTYLQFTDGKISSLASVRADPPRIAAPPEKK